MSTNVQCRETKGRINGRGRVICQVCDMPRHTTLQCYNWFNTSYNNPTIIPQFYIGKSNENQLMFRNIAISSYCPS